MIGKSLLHTTLYVFSELTLTFLSSRIYNVAKLFKNALWIQMFHKLGSKSWLLRGTIKNNQSIIPVIFEKTNILDFRLLTLALFIKNTNKDIILSFLNTWKLPTQLGNTFRFSGANYFKYGSGILIVIFMLRFFRIQPCIPFSH